MIARSPSAAAKYCPSIDRVRRSTGAMEACTALPEAKNWCRRKAKTGAPDSRARPVWSDSRLGRGPPAVRRARAGADPRVRCRERHNARAVPIESEPL